MAVTEARAAWQRAANRCFVQEDAKRAPKLACCQSSSSSKQTDEGPMNTADMPDNHAAVFMPHHINPTYCNLPPDTRWWLQLQPSYGYQKGLTHEQLNAFEAEMESVRVETINSLSKISEFHSHDDRGSMHSVDEKSVESSLDAECRISTDCTKKDPEVNKQEAKALYDKKNVKELSELKDTREDLKLVDLETIECLPWLASEKNVPWWRVTDRDDLASLVAQKSLNYVENCDLPPPQKMHIRRYSGSHPGSFDHDDIFNPLVQHGIKNLESAHGRQGASFEGLLQSGSDKPFRYSCTTSLDSTTESRQVPEGDPCKAQLLEALRHSQTRAREAEKVTKQVCAEKEHILQLFFRQASQLFAYKQWFQLLQLETLYYQVKNGEQPMSTLCPVPIPWIPQKGRKLQKNWQKSAKGKRGKRRRPSHDIGKYAVAIALGLSLVGAGLLLGWTVGWMLPL